MPGVAVIDNNCFDKLEDLAARRTFVGHLRAADWVPQITEVNVLEAIAITSAPKRDRVIAVVRELAGSIPILPWPLEMLAQLGNAMTEGKTSHWVVASSVDSFLHSREDALRVQEETAEFNRTIKKTIQSNMIFTGSTSTVGCGARDSEIRTQALGTFSVTIGTPARLALILQISSGVGLSSRGKHLWKSLINASPGDCS